MTLEEEPAEGQAAIQSDNNVWPPSEAAAAPKLSFNSLQQHEGFISLDSDAQKFLRLISKFPDWAKGHGSQTTDEELHDMLNLCESMGATVEVLLHLRHQTARAGSDGARQTTPADTCRAIKSHASFRASTVEPTSEIPAGPSEQCHQCHAVITPKWRTGPDGSGTLCNVCGLMYAKRARREARRG